MVECVLVGDGGGTDGVGTDFDGTYGAGTDGGGTSGVGTDKRHDNAMDELLVFLIENAEEVTQLYVWLVVFMN